MSRRRVVRTVGAAALLALAFATARHAAERSPAAPPPSLAGKLLVADSGMSDPRFFRTVIYLVRHDATGALGLVVNRSDRSVPLAVLLGLLGEDPEGVTGSMPIRYGGPVSPGSLFVLHTPDFRGPGTQVLGDGIALTTSPAVLRAIGTGAGPRQALLLLSYSGWGPGQLERELRGGAWITIPADPKLVFDEDDERKWQRAYARKAIEL